MIVNPFDIMPDKDTTITNKVYSITWIMFVHTCKPSKLIALQAQIKCYYGDIA